MRVLTQRLRAPADALHGLPRSARTRPVSFPIAEAGRADRDILPLFYCRETGATPQLVRFAGTGFRFGDSLVVTCWHCVAEHAPGHGYAAAFPREAGGFTMVPLLDVTQDENGTDLATASL